MFLYGESGANRTVRKNESPEQAEGETRPVLHRVRAASVKVFPRPRHPYANENGNDQPQDKWVMFEPERVEQDPRDGRQHDDLQPALQIRHCTLGYTLTETIPPEFTKVHNMEHRAPRRSHQQLETP